MPKQSLKQLYSHYYDIPLLLFLSSGTFLLGLFLPVITLKELVFWEHTFSVLTGILSLIVEKHYILAIIVFLFSVVFPILKIVMLLSLWFHSLTDDKRQKYVRWLGILGKWSMLDVFVVAITIVIAKISSFASAEPRIGIYFFGCSIILAIIVTMRMEHLIEKLENS